MTNMGRNIFASLVFLLVHLPASATAICAENQTELSIIATNQTLLSEYGVSFKFSGVNESVFSYIKDTDPVCVPKKQEKDDCFRLQINTDVGYNQQTPDVSPDSFIVKYDGENVDLRGPYLYGDDKTSLVGDIGECADTQCENDDEALFFIEGNSQLGIDWMVVNALTGESVVDCPSRLNDYNEENITSLCNWGYTYLELQTNQICLVKSNCYTLLIGVKDSFVAPRRPDAIVSATFDGKQIATFDYQQFLAIDFGSETSCALASCPQDDDISLEMWFYTEEGEHHPSAYVPGYVSSPNPDIAWSLTSKGSNTTFSGVLEKPLIAEGLSYFHYSRECIKRVDCFEFQMDTLYERKDGDEWYFETVAHRVSIDGVIFSDRDKIFGWDYPSSYTSLMGQCTSATDCSEGESLFDVSVLSSPTAIWDCDDNDDSCYARDMVAVFFDQEKSKDANELLIPDGTNDDNFIMARLPGLPLPSTQYRYLQCVQTQDACVGLAIWKYSFESDTSAELSVTVDTVLVEEGFAICDSEYCNSYYTTEALGSSCKNSALSAALSAGAIAGIVIGCIAFVLVLIGGMLVHRKKKANKSTTSTTGPVAEVVGTGNPSAAETADKSAVEANVYNDRDNTMTKHDDSAPSAPPLDAHASVPVVQATAVPVGHA